MKNTRAQLNQRHFGGSLQRVTELWLGRHHKWLVIPSYCTSPFGLTLMCFWFRQSVFVELNFVFVFFVTCWLCLPDASQDAATQHWKWQRNKKQTKKSAPTREWDWFSQLTWVEIHNTGKGTIFVKGWRENPTCFKTSFTVICKSQLSLSVCTQVSCLGLCLLPFADHHLGHHLSHLQIQFLISIFFQKRRLCHDDNKQLLSFLYSWHKFLTNKQDQCQVKRNLDSDMFTTWTLWLLTESLHTTETKQQKICPVSHQK